MPSSLRGHEWFVECVGWSPNGRWVASGGWDMRVCIWDAESGERVAEVREGEDAAGAGAGSRGVLPGALVSAVAFSPDGTLLAVGEGDARGGVRVVETAGWGTVGRLETGNGGVSAVAWSPDGTILAVASAAEAEVQLWVAGGGGGGVGPGAEAEAEAEAGEAGGWRRAGAVKGHAAAVSSLAFSPGAPAGRLALATASGDKDVRVWEVKPAAAEGGGGDGALAVAAGLAASDVRRIKGHPQAVSCVVWSPDGRRLATCCDDGKVRIFHGASGGLERELAGHTWCPLAASWHPTKARLATAGLDGDVRLWDTEAAQGAPAVARYALPQGHCHSVAWSPGGEVLAGGAYDWEVHLWRPLDPTSPDAEASHRPPAPPKPQPAEDRAEWRADRGALLPGGAQGDPAQARPPPTEEQLRELQLRQRQQQLHQQQRQKLQQRQQQQQQIHLHQQQQLKLQQQQQQQQQP